MWKPILLAILFILPASAQIPHYRVTMTPADYELLYTRNIFSNDFLPAPFRYNDTVWTEARIRFKGHSTRHYPKKPFRIRFSTSNLFQGQRQINFNSMYTDKSYLRERLAWILFEQMNALAPTSHHGKFSINTDYKGLYLFIDKIDQYFLQRKGRIIAPMYEADDTYAMADLTVQPDSLLRLYYSKEIGDPNDYSDLRAMIEAINYAPDSLFADVVHGLFDMNSVYNWFAGNTLMMMGDSYNKNYLLYRDTSRATQQWTVIPWDYDLSFGRTGDPNIPYPGSLLNDGFAYTFPPLSGPSNVLKDRLWATPSLREEFRMRVDTMLQTFFIEDFLHPIIDAIAAEVQHEIHPDPHKWGSYDDFIDHVEGLKCYVTARRNYLLSTFIHPPSGQYNIATLPVSELNVPYHFVAFDGRQIASMWFLSMQGLDSIRVQVYPDSTPPAVSDPPSERFVKRWVVITPYPANAQFTARLQWMYRDLYLHDREVGVGVQDERLLRAHHYDGVNWQILPSTVNAYANYVTVDQITHAMVGPGKYFALLMPESYTQKWFRQANFYWQRWHDINFPSNQRAYIVGEHGTVLRSDDGGTTWIAHHIGINGTFFKVATVGIDTLFAVGEVGSLHRSTDGGNSWARIPLGTILRMNNVRFATPTMGWIVGDAGFVARTTDGGFSWSSGIVDSTISLHGIAAFEDGDVFVAGSGGKMYRTSDGGVTWSIVPQFTTAGIRALVTHGGSHLWAIGEGGSVSYSLDRGITWGITPIPSTITLRGAAVIDSSRLYVAGDAGKVFYTTDNGVNWYSQYTATSHDLNALAFLDSSLGYAVGNSGIILKTTEPGTTTSGGAPLADVPVVHRLYQNFPNPFNPATTILFDIARPSSVVLKVYNILGQEVAVLVDDVLGAGRHTAVWDAHRVASGVYFYRMKARSVDGELADVQTKKMVVIR